LYSTLRPQRRLKMTGKFKVGDKVRVLEGAKYAGVSNLPFNATVIRATDEGSYQVEVEGTNTAWFVPEEFLAPLDAGEEQTEQGTTEEVVWASEPLTEWYEVRHDGEVLNRCETYGPARRGAEEWVRQNWWAR